MGWPRGVDGRIVTMSSASLKGTTTVYRPTGKSRWTTFRHRFSYRKPRQSAIHRSAAQLLGKGDGSAFFTITPAHKGGCAARRLVV
ncbi:hypothetical protein ACLK19_02480 [Escherichia coli]